MAVIKILVLHGPNLNLLGKREPKIYGNTSLAELDAQLLDRAGQYGVELTIIQSNQEGLLIDALHEVNDCYDGVIINPGAYSHYSLAIADAMTTIKVPIIEVHLSNVAGRETYRRKLVTAAAATGLIAGLGVQSYLIALKVLVEKKKEG